MLPRILLRSLWYRRGRSAISLAAVGLACALAISSTQVAVDARSKLQHDLRAFGANVALLPSSGRPARFEECVDTFARDPAVRSRLLAASPVLEGAASAAGRPVALIGVRWQAAPALFAYWRVRSEAGGAAAWPAPGAAGACLVGSRLSRALRLQPGQRLELARGGRSLTVRVAGVITSGDAAEEQCFVSLKEAQAILGSAGDASTGLAVVSGEAAQVTRAVRDAAPGVPCASVEPIRALAAAEGALFSRTRWLMLAVSLAVMLLAALAVLTTSMAGVVDREPEVALLKALGWEDRRAMGLFLAEAAVVGLCAGLVGAILGFFGGRALAGSLFNTTLQIRPWVLSLSLLIGLFLSIAGTWLPARRALRLEPARALRNE